MDSGFQLLDSSFFFQLNLDSGFQLFVGFRIPTAVFWVPKYRILVSTSKISKIPDSTGKNFRVFEIRIPLLEAIPLHVIYCCAAVLILSTMYMNFLLYMYFKFLKKEKHFVLITHQIIVQLIAERKTNLNFTCQFLPSLDLYNIGLIIIFKKGQINVNARSKEIRTRQTTIANLKWSRI